MVYINHKYLKFYIFIFLCIIFISCFMLFTDNNKKEFNVAVVGPFTGNNAANGESMQKGIFMCLKNAKKNNSLDKINVNVDFFDDKNDVASAKKIALQIIEKQTYDLVIGHYFSSTSNAAGKIYRNNQIPAITASATDVSLVKNNDWYFRVVPGNDIQGCFIANYIHNILKVKNINIIYENDTYGQDLVNNFEKAASIFKMKVKKWNISEGSFDDTITDIIYELQSRNDKEVVFIASHADKGAKIVSSIKYPGAKFTIIGSDAFATDTFIKYLKKESFQERASAGYHSNEIYTVSAFLNDVGNQKSQLFIKDFKNMFHEEPSWVSASYYDAMQLAIKVFNEISVKEKTSIEERRQQIKNHLLSINTYDEALQGITGKIFLNKFGDVVQPYFVGVYYDQSIVSALDQYQLTAKTSSPNEILQKILDGNMIKLNNRLMNKTSVVYTGMSINKITNINLSNKMYTMDFYLWFRYNKQLKNVVDIEFENSVSPFFLNTKMLKDSHSKNDKNIITVLLDKVENDVAIKAFRIKSTFLNDFNFRSFPFDHHKLCIKFKHRFLTNDQIMFIPDNRGMKQNELVVDDHSNNKIVIEGWDSYKTFNYQTVISNQSSLGDPSAFQSVKTLQYSCFNSEIEIKRKVVSYILKNLLTFVLVIVTFIIYFIPESQFGTRISLAMSVLLTSAFSHIRMTNTIRVSYLLAAEYGFFGVYSIAALSLIISVMAYNKEHIDTDNDAKKDYEKRLYLSKIRMIGLMISTIIMLLVFYFIYYNYILASASEKFMTNIISSMIFLLWCIFFTYILSRLSAKKRSIEHIKEHIDYID